MEYGQMPTTVKQNAGTVLSYKSKSGNLADLANIIPTKQHSLKYIFSDIIIINIIIIHLRIIYYYTEI